MSEKGLDANARSTTDRAAQAVPYVNHMAISFDLAEVRIDFGQIADTGQPPRITSQLVTSPANFSRFHRQFCESMRQYQGQYQDSFGAKGEQ